MEAGIPVDLVGYLGHLKKVLKDDTSVLGMSLYVGYEQQVTYIAFLCMYIDSIQSLDKQLTYQQSRALDAVLRRAGTLVCPLPQAISTTADAQGIYTCGMHESMHTCPQ